VALCVHVFGHMLMHVLRQAESEQWALGQLDDGKIETTGEKRCKEV